MPRFALCASCSKNIRQLSMLTLPLSLQDLFIINSAKGCSTNLKWNYSTIRTGISNDLYKMSTMNRFDGYRTAVYSLIQF